MTSELVPKSNGEITVLVKEGGAVTVDGRPATDANLTSVLLEAARNIQADKKVVVVRGDRQAAYGKVIWIMDAARLVGLRNVSLATEQSESEQGG